MQNAVHVRSFATVVESGSFTRAAERLDLTQAAISQHIRALEDRLGPLLIRRPRAITVTPAGQALLGYARTMEQAERHLQLQLEDAEAPGGDIGITTPGSAGLLLYPHLLDYQIANPGTIIRHRIAPDPEVLTAILERQYDIGLVSIRPEDLRVTATAIAEEPLELIVPADTRVSTWEDLSRLGFIDHPDGFGMATRLLGQRFPKHPGVRRLPISGFSNQIASILDPVARGLGFTVLPRYARQAYAKPEAIEVVPGGHDVADTLWLIHRSEWPLSKRVAAVVEMMPGWLASAT